MRLVGHGVIAKLDLRSWSRVRAVPCSAGPQFSAVTIDRPNFILQSSAVNTVLRYPEVIRGPSLMRVVSSGNHRTTQEPRLYVGKP